MYSIRSLSTTALCVCVGLPIGIWFGGLILKSSAEEIITNIYFSIGGVALYYVMIRLNRPSK